MTDQLDCNSAIQRSFWDVECVNSLEIKNKDFLALKKSAIRSWKKELSRLMADLSHFSVQKMSNYLSATARKIADWEQAPREVREIYDELNSLYFKKEAEEFKLKYFETGKEIIHMLSVEIGRKRQVDDLKMRGQEILKLLEAKLLSDFEKVSERSQTRFVVRLVSFRLSPAAENVYQELKRLGEKALAAKFKADYEAMLALQAIKLKLKRG